MVKSGLEFFFQKNPFFRAKNATATSWRSGTDFCWLFCAENPFGLVYSKNVFNLCDGRRKKFSITHDF